MHTLTIDYYITILLLGKGLKGIGKFKIAICFPMIRSSCRFVTKKLLLFFLFFLFFPFNTKKYRTLKTSNKQKKVIAFNLNLYRSKSVGLVPFQD